MVDMDISKKPGWYCVCLVQTLSISHGPCSRTTTTTLCVFEHSAAGGRTNLSTSPSSVNRVSGSSNESGLVAQQKGNQMRNLLGRADALDGRVDFVLVFLLHHSRVYGATKLTQLRDATCRGPTYGAMALMRTFLNPFSFAALLTSPITPCFAAE